MKKTLLLCALVLAGFGANAQTTISDTALVRSVVPRMERMPVQREVCSTVSAAPAAAAQNSPNVGGAILGTIVGGVIGSRFGGGDGRIAATAVGAGVGAVVGSNMGSNGATTAPVPSRHCTVETVYESQQNGYLVTYDYQGRQYIATMPYDPGSHLRVNVSVTPAQ